MCGIYGLEYKYATREINFVCLLSPHGWRCNLFMCAFNSIDRSFKWVYFKFGQIAVGDPSSATELPILIVRS